MKEERMLDMVKSGDWAGVAATLRREGHMPGLSVAVGTVVAVRIPADAQILVGRVVSVQAAEIWLEQCSWIDHTGEHFGDGMQKGEDARGWSSEFMGTVCVMTGVGITVQMLLNTFKLPRKSIRP